MDDNIIKGCPCCSGRRDFLKRLSYLGGAAFLMPVGIKAAEVEKVNPVKIRLIYSIWDSVQVRFTWPNAGFDFRNVMENVTGSLNAIKEVQFIPGMAYDEKTVQLILDEDERMGDIAGYMVIQMNSWPDAAGVVARKTDKPLLFCSYPYSGIGGWDVTNSAIIRSGRKGYAFMSSKNFEHLVAMASTFAVLKNGSSEDFVKAADDKRLSLTPAFSGIKPKEGPLSCLSPEDTLAKIKGMKLLTLQGEPQKEALMKDFGIEVIGVQFSELNGLWEKVTEKRAKPLFDRWKKEAKSISDVSDDTLMGVARMYFAMDDLLKQYGAQAVTIDCLRGCYAGELGAYPCLGFMELQDNGLIGACENDVSSTLSMIVASAMTGGRMGFISDPVIDSGNRAIVYAHCVATRKFLGRKCKKVPFEILTHSEDRQGASIRSFAPEGYPVTTFRIEPSQRAIIIHTAITTGNDCDDRACRTKIVAEVNGDYEKIYREWDRFGWHRVTVYGDFSKDMEKLAKHIGYEIVWES